MIRLARSDDILTVSAIVTAAYSIYLTRIGTTPGPMRDDYRVLVEAGRVHIIEDHGTTVGLVVLIPEEDVTLLDNVAVSPHVQGLGYGAQLLAFAEAQARAAGHRAIRLYTHELMTENIARYSRLGYIETHRAEEIGLKRVYMTKMLM